MTSNTSPRPSPLVVLASQLQLSEGHFVTDDDLRAAGAIGVNYFVRDDVRDLDSEQIERLISPDLVALDQRVVDRRRYAAELQRFATAPVTTTIVTRSRRGTVYLVGRLTGSYRYEPGRFFLHPHIRPVEWLGELSKGSCLGGNTRHTVRPVTDRSALAELAALGR